MDSNTLSRNDRIPKALLILVLVSFSVLTGLAVYHYGFLGIFLSHLTTMLLCKYSLIY